MNINTSMPMTDVQREALCDELYLPVMDIVKKSIDDIMLYVERNKEQLRKSISDMVIDDPNPVASSIMDNLNVSLLALATAMLEESVYKYQMALTATRAMGMAHKGWDELYATWTSAMSNAASQQSKPTSN